MNTVEREVINNEAVEMLRKGISRREISRSLKVGESTLSKIAQKAGIVRDKVMTEEKSAGIVKRLGEGMLYKDISAEFGVRIPTISELAREKGLGRESKTMAAVMKSEQTLEDIHKANPYKVGDKVIVRDKNGSDTYKHYKCTVEKITDHIVFARGDNGRMYTASFAAIGMDSNLIRKVG